MPAPPPASQADSYPAIIHSVEELDEMLTRPTPALVEFIRTLPSPLVVLGAGGKMGPTLCVRALRAAEQAGHPLDVFAVSRFSDESARRWLETRGVRTLSCDLMNLPALKKLPDAQNVIYLVGLKFGTQQHPARTWAVNTLTPAHVCERYPGARVVALSTGNVYPLSPVARGGSVESDPLTPLGEYANAAVARERVFEYCAQQQGVSLALVRLNYAVELRYGVLVDIALKVVAGDAIDVTMGHLNCIWQGDANDMILRMLPLAAEPPAAFNLTGREVLSVRELAVRLAELMERPVTITGSEAETALLSNPARAYDALGAPHLPLDLVLRWTADWVLHGGPALGKPTHFEARDGVY